MRPPRGVFPQHFLTIDLTGMDYTPVESAQDAEVTLSDYLFKATEHLPAAETVWYETTCGGVQSLSVVIRYEEENPAWFPLGYLLKVEEGVQLYVSTEFEEV
jgi:hypothetical protein